MASRSLRGDPLRRAELRAQAAVVRGGDPIDESERVGGVRLLLEINTGSKELGIRITCRCIGVGVANVRVLGVRRCIETENVGEEPVCGELDHGRSPLVGLARVECAGSTERAGHAVLLVGARKIGIQGAAKEGEVDTGGAIPRQESGVSGYRAPRYLELIKV